MPKSCVLVSVYMRTYMYVGMRAQFCTSKTNVILRFYSTIQPNDGDETNEKNNKKKTELFDDHRRTCYLKYIENERLLLSFEFMRVRK